MEHSDKPKPPDKPPEKVPMVSALVIAGVILAVLCTYQLPVNEAAIVSTLGKPRVVDVPGLKFRLPWPMQKITKIDKRQQLYEGKPQQTTTSDDISLIVQSFCSWEVSDPLLFMNSVGNRYEAEVHLRSLLKSSQETVIRQHPLADFIATGGGTKLDAVETVLAETLQKEAGKSYGISIKYVGIAQISLHDKSTASVLNRMRQEHEQQATQIRSDGDKRAKKIRYEADSTNAKTVAEAEAKAKEIRGDALIKAAEQFEEFKDDLDFAIFLRKLDALEETTRTKTTLVLDPGTPPYDLLRFEKKKNDK
jgi:membrane protease subunit HflC